MFINIVMFSAICYVKQCENMGLIHGDKYSLCVCITVLVDGQKYFFLECYFLVFCCSTQMPKMQNVYICYKDRSGRLLVIYLQNQGVYFPI